MKEKQSNLIYFRVAYLLLFFFYIKCIFCSILCEFTICMWNYLEFFCKPFTIGQLNSLITYQLSRSSKHYYKIRQISLLLVHLFISNLRLTLSVNLAKDDNVVIMTIWRRFSDADVMSSLLNCCQSSEWIPQQPFTT